MNDFALKLTDINKNDQNDDNKLMDEVLTTRGHITASTLRVSIAHQIFHIFTMGYKMPPKIVSSPERIRAPN